MNKSISLPQLPSNGKRATKAIKKGNKPKHYKGENIAISTDGLTDLQTFSESNTPIDKSSPFFHDEAYKSAEFNIRNSISKNGFANLVLMTPAKTNGSNPTTSHVSTSSFVRFRRGAGASAALQQAMSHVKDFMTDVQKAIVLLREGKISMDNGDYRGAIEIFSECISLNPSISVFSCRATCYKLLDMYSEAYFDYCYMIRLQPEDGSFYCSRGLTLAKLKKLTMAYEDLDNAIEMEPNNPNLYFGRSNVYADCNRHESAVEDLTRALYELDHLSVGGVSTAANHELRLKCGYRRALSYFELKQYEKVVQDVNDVLVLDPNSISARALLGKALKVLCEYKKAEEQLTIAILLDETMATLYTERGDLRFRTGQKNKLIEAIYDFDKAIRLLESKLPLSNNFHHILNTNGQQGFVIPASFYKELEEQLAEAYFKRAQAKLMIDNSSSDPEDSNNAIHYRAALSDALKAAHYIPDDDDYLMIVAICYIKLNQYEDAKGILEEVLARSPTNYKALFNYSFCQRATGDQTVAIEGLTKIIAYSQSEGDSLTRAYHSSNDNPQYSGTYSSKVIAAGMTSLTGGGSSNHLMSSTANSTGNLVYNNNAVATIPMHKVYEMRGTMLHEMQAHKLALSDLGKAIAINPSRADNYFLRGDCHCKMGNYEQAIVDMTTAEEKGFTDLCSLLLSRGAVYRLMGDSYRAAVDFARSLELVDEEDTITRIRVQSFLAFCLIDQGQYSEAYDAILIAQDLNTKLLNLKMIQMSKSKRQGSLMSFMGKLERRMSCTYPTAASSDQTTKGEINDVGVIEEEVDDDEDEEDEENDDINLSATYDEYITKKKPPPSALESELLYLRRVDFIVLYHIAVSVYMQKQYERADEMLTACLSSDMRKYLPDDLTLGALQYFAALTCVGLPQPNFEKAILLMVGCYKTHWVDLRRNKFLYNYTLAKIHQCHDKQQNHKVALEHFSLAIEIMPDNPYCFFRRAWSFKGLGNFKAAGEDFETAKSLRPQDPNFSLDYRRISMYQYMVIDTEPDLVERFPPLLPLPGMGARL